MTALGKQNHCRRGEHQLWGADLCACLCGQTLVRKTKGVFLCALPQICKAKDMFCRALVCLLWSQNKFGFALFCFVCYALNRVTCFVLICFALCVPSLVCLPVCFIGYLSPDAKGSQGARQSSMHYQCVVQCKHPGDIDGNCMRILQH